MGWLRLSAIHGRGGLRVEPRNENFRLQKFRRVGMNVLRSALLWSTLAFPIYFVLGSRLGADWLFSCLCLLYTSDAADE